MIPYQLVPTKVFFTKGTGQHPDRLSSFEQALRQGKIEKYNLVYVSSILPPHCKIVSREKALTFLQPGQIVYCVMAQNSTHEPNRQIAAAIGLAVPTNEQAYGYLSEYHTFGETDEKAGEKAEDIAASLLASTLGIEFDIDKAWDERKEVYKMSGKIIKSRNITQSARGDKYGKWTTVIAAACFIL